MAAIAHVTPKWLSHRCIDCGERKPLFTTTEYCDSCAEWHGL
jgi:hypothetical protein